MSDDPRPNSHEEPEGNRVKIRTVQAVVRGHLYDADSGELVRPAPEGKTSFSVADVLTEEEAAALANWPAGPDLRYGVDYELGEPYTPRVVMVGGGFMFVDGDLFTPEPYLIDGQEPAVAARQELLDRLARLGDLAPGGDPLWSIAAVEGEIVLPLTDGREG